MEKGTTHIVAAWCFKHAIFKQMWVSFARRHGTRDVDRVACILLNLWLRVTWALYAGFKLGRQAAWRPRCNQDSVVKLIDGTVLWQ